MSAGAGDEGRRSKPARDAVREHEELERVFKALAHAARRHILLVLHVRGGDVPAGVIAGRFAHSWPTTTRHLRVLREAGLVSVVRRGRERVYRLERQRMRSVVGDWLAWFDRTPAAAQSEPPFGN